ncbi:MAG: flagellar basal body P-ring formation protein FlgA [Planctomycetes bacterium]|nr:flagellar basal body P-ring formation protein FlgA [Planctomycetota bacterium]
MRMIKLCLPVNCSAWIAVAVMLVLGGFAQAQVHIELLETAVSRGSYIRLNEVAEVESTQEGQQQLEGIFLGSAPRKDASRILTRNQIKAQLLAHGVNEEDLTISGADQVQVLPAPLPGSTPGGGAVVNTADQAEADSISVASPTVQQGEAYKTGRDFREEVERVVVDLARQQILQDLGIAGAQVEIELTRLNDLEPGMESAAAVKIERTPSRVNSGSLTINYGLYDQNCQRLGDIDAYLKIEVRIPAVTATRAVARGDIISEMDVEICMVSLNEGRNSYSSLEEVVGMRTKTSLPAGKTIQTGKIEIMPIVQRGQNVSVSAKIGRIHVRQRGIAMQSGAAGDIIPVKNQQSGKSYPARIYADGRLELVVVQP